MSNKDFGGRMLVRSSNGEVLSLRGTFNLSPTKNTGASITNQDGSLDRVLTPRSPRCEINLADRGIDLDELIAGDRRDWTIEEDFTGVTHYFTQSIVTGEPQVNRLTGEVTNFMIEGNYSKRGV